MGVPTRLERQKERGKVGTGHQWQLQGCLVDVGAKMKVVWLVGLKPHHEDALLSVMAKENSAVTFPVLNAFNHLEAQSTAQLGVTGLCRQPAARSPACLGGLHETTLGSATCARTRVCTAGR